MSKKAPTPVLIKFPHPFWLGLEYARGKAGATNRTLFIRTLLAEALEKRGVDVNPAARQ